MQFCKMNGAGNDFIILNNMAGNLQEETFPKLAKTLCRRRLSIGADGLMVVEKPRQGGDFRMLFYNADGSVGEMCGNGARCICRYGCEKGLAGERQTVETVSGFVEGRRVDRRNYRIRLTDPTVVKMDETVEALGRYWPCAYVELGSPGLPHAVVHCTDLAEKTPDALRDLAKALRWSPSFPKGANVNFYDVTGENQVRELTYERGVEDFTLACGTGSGATVLVLTRRKEVSGQDVEVSVPGGTLRVTVEDGTTLWLAGLTNFVCEGEVMDEEL